MPDFQNPLVGFSQGVQGGVGMALQFEQAKQQRRAFDFNKDLTFFQTSLHYAATKGIAPGTKAQLVNQANKVIKHWYPKMEFPELTADNMSTYQSVLKQGNDMIGEGLKDQSKAHFLAGQWGQINADWAAKNAEMEQLNAMQLKAKEDVTKTLDTMGSNYFKQQELDRKGMPAEPKDPTTQEALKRIFEIKTRLATIRQMNEETMNLIKLEPSAANALAGKSVSPEQMAEIQAAADNEISNLIQFVPEKMRGVQPQPGPSPSSPVSLPPKALQALSDAGGQPVPFTNGQTWILENGVPKRIK